MTGDTGAPATATDIIPGGGELGALIRAYDWSNTSLGPIDQWPQSLRTATNVVLQSPLPLVMLWGADGVMIYNDAYSALAGKRHPRLLGSRVLEGWPEVADFNRRVMEVGLAGGTLSFKDQQLTLYRNNVPEEVWMDLNYGPVLNENGKPAGVLAIVVETTQRVLAERALAAERAAVEEANRRLAAESEFLHGLFEQAPSLMAMLSGPDHVFRLTNASYRNLIGGREVLGQPLREAIPEIEGQGFLELVDQVYATGEAFIGTGMKASLRRVPDGPLEDRYLDFIYQPVTNAAGQVTGIFVDGQDVTDRLKTERHLRLVVNELNHRVKNTLSMMQAIAAQTFRDGEDLAGAHATFSARVMALGRANDLLTAENWEGASLKDVIARTAAAHSSDGDRFIIKGPVVRLSPKTAMAVSMALHELATNAIKYGALSSPSGMVEVRWTLTPEAAGERLTLTWREMGGPPVAIPARRGFGTRLIERGLAAELDGQVQVLFEPTGVICVVEVSMRPYNDE
jgi:two-component sensor histidine kinase